VRDRSATGKSQKSGKRCQRHRLSGGDCPATAIEPVRQLQLYFLKALGNTKLTKDHIRIVGQRDAPPVKIDSINPALAGGDTRGVNLTVAAPGDSSVYTLQLRDPALQLRDPIVEDHLQVLIPGWPTWTSRFEGKLPETSKPDQIRNAVGRSGDQLSGEGLCELPSPYARSDGIALAGRCGGSACDSRWRSLSCWLIPPTA